MFSCITSRGPVFSRRPGAKSSRVAMEINSKIPLEPNPAWWAQEFVWLKQGSVSVRYLSEIPLNRRSQTWGNPNLSGILQNIYCKVETAFMIINMPLIDNFNLGIPSTHLYLLANIIFKSASSINYIISPFLCIFSLHPSPPKTSTKNTTSTLQEISNRTHFSRTPKKPEYLIAGSQLTERGPLVRYIYICKCIYTLYIYIWSGHTIYTIYIYIDNFWWTHGGNPMPPYVPIVAWTWSTWPLPCHSRRSRSVARPARRYSVLCRCHGRFMLLLNNYICIYIYIYILTNNITYNIKTNKHIFD